MVGIYVSFQISQRSRSLEGLASWSFLGQHVDRWLNLSLYSFVCYLTPTPRV